MRRVVLRAAGLETSSLGLGTSRLHYLAPRERARLVGEALALGIRHFDTAPAYGDGVAERALGAALGRQRTGVVIASKFGITPDPLVDRWALPWLPVRAVRRFARRGVASVMPPLAGPALRASVEASLRRLGTDYLDLLLLHEPAPARLPDPEGLVDALGRLRAEGVIRGFGLAGAWAALTAVRAALPVPDWVTQTGEAEWAPPDVPDITYGAISRGPQSYRQPAVPGDVALARLRAARERRPDGVLLVSTTHPERLPALAEAGG